MNHEITIFGDSSEPLFQICITDLCFLDTYCHSPRDFTSVILGRSLLLPVHMDINKLTIHRLVSFKNDPLDLFGADIDLELSIISTAEVSLQML